MSPEPLWPMARQRREPPTFCLKPETDVIFVCQGGGLNDMRSVKKLSTVQCSCSVF